VSGQGRTVQQWSSTPVGLPQEALDTPALIVDLDVLERNVARMAGTFRQAGVGWRPHTKGIKVPAVAHRLLAAGAFGVTCAKVSEAEVMAGAGIRDILIANEVIGEVKTRRLAELCTQADVVVAADSVGMGRCGVAPGAGVVRLAQEVAAAGPLRFAGVMAWEGHTAAMPDQEAKVAAIRAAVGTLVESAEACRAAGLPVSIVSCGGTGTYQTTAHLKGVTEVQAGGGIFGDVHYRDDFRVDHECALTVLTTVVSRPTPQMVVTDAGFKSLSSAHGLPQPIGLPEGQVAAVSLSAEHGRLRLETPNETLQVGDLLPFIVGYSDSTVMLHDTLYGVRGGVVQAAWPIAGRGKLQ